MTNPTFVLAIEAVYGKQILKLGTELLMAAADAYKNRGKKSIFGKDKWAPAHDRFMDKIQELGLSLRMIGRAPSLESHDVVASIDELMTQLNAAFPSWPESYSYWDWFKSVATPSPRQSSLTRLSKPDQQCSQVEEESWQRFLLLQRTAPPSGSLRRSTCLSTRKLPQENAAAEPRTQAQDISRPITKDPVQVLREAELVKRQIENPDEFG